LQAFDASSIIYAWDNYPLENFPPLWQWIADQAAQGDFVISKVAFEEVKGKAPDCAEWLRKQNIEQIEMTNEILQEAMRIKGLLGISGDNYHPKGVGENDILIIATAKVHGHEIISNEAPQRNPPKSLAKRKIPAVCDLNGVGVRCINFLTLIKRSKKVFGG